MKNNHMASDMCVELARFYRLGISGGKEIVTVREELEILNMLSMSRKSFCPSRFSS